MADYALFHNEVQISKARNTRAAAAQEAYDRGIVFYMLNGFDLAEGYEIKLAEENDD